MKKRSLSIFVGLFCLVMALCAVPVVTASAAGKKGARIEYDTSYFNEFGEILTDRSSAEYFKVLASQGAIVTYKEGKKEVATDCDDIWNGDEVYYFKLPKKGEKEITVKFEDGSPEVKLKVIVNSPQKGKTETVNLAVKNAKYDPMADGYEYGRITATVEGEQNKEYSFEYDYCFGADIFPLTYAHPIKMDTEDEKQNDKDKMKMFIKPLLREGATVNIYPCSAIVYGVESGSWSVSYKDYYYKISSISSTELKVSLITDTVKIKIKTAKVKIPKQKNPPKVKIDAVKGTIGLTDKMEYRFRKYDASGELGDFDEWTKGSKGMKLNAVSGGIITNGGVIQVRLAKTNKAVCSKSLNINIPSQSAIDTTKIKWDGVTTNGSLTISDWNKDTKPYEYTLTAPSDSTKWTTVKDGKITFTKKKPAAGTIYIREKGINENSKKKLELKLPSTIASATVSGSGIPSEKIVVYSGK